MAACVPRVARSWPPDEPSAKLLDCPRCGCTLLHSEYVGRPTSSLDSALRFHHSGACAIPVDERHARSLERWLSDPTSSAAPWPDGEPPLVFCARRRLRTLALKLLDRPTVDGGVDGALRDGLTALHLAALGRDEALVSALLAAGASARCRSGDGGGRPGGRTALHCAAEAGAPAAIIDALLAADPESVAAEDWEGCTPAVVAALSAHDALARSLGARQLAWSAEEATAEERKAAERELMEEVEALAGAASERALRARLAQLSVRERARAALNIDERPLLHAAHVLRGEVSAADCDWLLGTLRDAIAVEGWASARHKFHPTVDYPVARCPEAAAWMRANMGPQSVNTVSFVGDLVELRREQGRLAEAEQELGSLVADARAGLGPQHKTTLIAEARAARLRHAQPDGAAAGAAELRGVVEKMGEFLGAAHQETVKYQGLLDEMERSC